MSVFDVNTGAGEEKQEEEEEEIGMQDMGHPTRATPRTGTPTRKRMWTRERR